MKRALAIVPLLLLATPGLAAAQQAPQQMAPQQAAPAQAAAPSIADGTYTVKVQRVVDAKHVVVATDDGKQATLAAGRDTIDFSKVKPNDQLRLSVANGAIGAFVDMTGPTPAVAKP